MPDGFSEAAYIAGCPDFYVTRSRINPFPDAIMPPSIGYAPSYQSLCSPFTLPYQLAHLRAERDDFSPELVSYVYSMVAIDGQAQVCIILSLYHNLDVDVANTVLNHPIATDTHIWIESEP